MGYPNHRQSRFRSRDPNTRKLFTRLQRIRRRPKLRPTATKALAVALTAILAIFILSFSQGPEKTTQTAKNKELKGQVPKNSSASQSSRRGDETGPGPASGTESYWQAPETTREDEFLVGAKKQLEKLTAILDKPRQIREREFASLASSRFVCEALLPDPMTEIHRDGSLSVAVKLESRNRELPALFKHEGPPGLADALATLLGAFGEVSTVRTELRILRTRMEEKQAVTEILFGASVTQPFRGFEQHAIWLCGWDPGTSGGLPMLSWIRPVRYEQVAASAKAGVLYSDCTTSVLGGNPSFHEQIVPGASPWLERIQRGYGIHYFTPQGLAVGDLNGDGLDDVFLCQPGGLPNHVYLARSDGTAVEDSASMGLDWLDPTVSALIVDLDNDGDQDLVLVTHRALYGLENDGAGKFAVRVEVPLQDGALGLTAADYDLDGKLDLFVCGFGGMGAMDAEHFSPPIPIFDAKNGGACLLLRNAGNWRFVDVSSAAGLESIHRGWFASAVWEDIDADGDPDLVLASPYGSTRLLRNDQARFTDITDQSEFKDLSGRHSVAIGDVDNDGRLDLYLSGNDSSLGYRLARQAEFASLPDDQRRKLFGLANGGFLFLNQGNGVFKASPRNGDIQFSRYAQGSCFLDVNQDGLQDLLVVNGRISNRSTERSDEKFWNEVVAASPSSLLAHEGEEYRQAWRSLYREIREGASLAGFQRNCCYLNLGESRFGEISATSGLDFLEDARGVARVDWDNDGDLDLWVVNQSGPRLRLLRNDQESGHHFLKIRLRGSLCNRDAIGARVTVHLSPGLESLASRRSPRQITRTVTAGDGFLSQSSKWLHFGLGGAKAIDKVVVEWPGGNPPEEITGLDRNGHYVIQQGTKRADAWTPPQRAMDLTPSRLASSGPGPSNRVPLGARIPMPELSITEKDQRVTSLYDAARPTLLRIRPATRDEFGARALHVQEEANAAWRSWTLDLPAGNAPAGPSRSPPESTKTGTISTESLRKLDLLQRSLTEAISPLRPPAAFLVDRHGRLAVFYRAEIDPEQLREDVARLAKEDPRNMAHFGVPFHGRWQRLFLDPGYRQLANAFREAGFDSDAERYENAHELWSQSSSGSIARSHSSFMSSHTSPLDLELARHLVDEGRADEVLARQAELLLVSNTPWVIQTNMGTLLLAKGELLSAQKHLNEAVMRRPKYAPAVGTLGIVLLRLHRAPEGVRQLRAAVELDATDPLYRRTLAWTLATHPNPSIRDGRDAIRLAKSPSGVGSAAWLDVLAAAYAEVGDFSAANETAREALRLAKEERQAELAREIQKRWANYQKDEPYRQPESPDRP